MAPNVKERIINWTVSIVTTIVGIIIAFKLSANDTDNRELRKNINSKLDKIEYEKDQKHRWDAHDKIQSKNDKRSDDTYKMVKFLYERELSKK